jgi:hypothetical protein
LPVPLAGRHDQQTLAADDDQTAGKTQGGVEIDLQPGQHLLAVGQLRREALRPDGWQNGPRRASGRRGVDKNLGTGCGHGKNRRCFQPGSGQGRKYSALARSRAALRAAVDRVRQAAGLTQTGNRRQQVEATRQTPAIGAADEFAAGDVDRLAGAGEGDPVAPGRRRGRPASGQ